MKKYLLMFAALLLITACSNKTATLDKEASAEEQPEEVDNSIDKDLFKETMNEYLDGDENEVLEPLPFNVDEVMSNFESIIENETDAKINYDETNITMINGSFSDIHSLLNALNNHLGNGEEVNDITTEVIDGLKADEYFIGDYIVDEVKIHISAVDASFIGISIMKE